MEWYRLAARHCPHNFLLHDDFYLADGTADQPHEEVVDAHLYLAPRLEEKSQDLNDLWEFTLTRYSLGDDVLNAWRKHSSTAVIDFLTQSYETRKDAHSRSTALTIVSKASGIAAADLVRRAWRGYPDEMYFGALAKASVACLPAEEGFERCLEQFTKMPLKKQRTAMMYMSHFKNPRMISWIEANFQPPVTEDWGRLAASSGIAWERLDQWLQSGRPLSLVALDALACVARHAKEGRLHLYVPVLGLPSKEEVTLHLQAYEARDQVPRVQNSIDDILEEFQFLGPQPG